VTAGASTPRWMIRRVVDHLQSLAQQQSHTARGFAAQVFDAVTYLNFIVALGAAAMYYASCTLQGLAYHVSGSLLALLYFLSMYLWNSLSSLERTQHLGLQRYRFYRSHRGLLFVLAGLSIVSMLAFSYQQGRLLFYLMLFATAAGSAYQVTIVPKFLRRIVPYSNLRDVPTSRDLFVALAWGILLTVIPHALSGTAEISAHTVLTFVWIFSLAYLRSVIFDLRDIEGDRIMGRETLVSIIGERRARQGILIVMRLLLVIVAAYAAIDILGYRGLSSSSISLLFQLPVLLYLYLFERQNRTKGIRRASVFTALMDFQFVLAGVLAVLGSAVAGRW
jgi:4-hydroxy-3-methylbut-2-enyl diphosphate reductase